MASLMLCTAEGEHAPELFCGIVAEVPAYADRRSVQRSELAWAGTGTGPPLQVPPGGVKRKAESGSGSD